MGSLHHPRTTVCHATRTSLVRLDFDHLEWICPGRGRRQSSGCSPDPDGLGVGEWEPRGGCSDIITPSSIGVSSASTEPMQPICNVRAVSLLEVGVGLGGVEQNSKAFFQPLSPLPLLITLPSTQTSAPCLPHEHQTHCLRFVWLVLPSVPGIHLSLHVYGFLRIDFGGRSFHTVLIPYLRKNQKVES